jgi:glycosyltransferase involved in cell wall biosynthesis
MQGPPRIALVFDTFPPHRDGGAGFAHNLSRELASRGGEVHMITSESAAEFDGSSMPESFHLLPVMPSWTWTRSDRRALDSARDALDAIRPDVIHVIYPSSDRPNGYHLPAMLKRIGKSPVIATFFALSIFRGVTMRTRLTGLRLIATSDILVSHDQYYLGLLRRLSAWRGSPVRYIPVGANVAGPPEIYDPDNVSRYRARLRLPDADYYISHFGFVDASRDIDTLLEALRRLRAGGTDLRLIMIGGTQPAPTQDLSDHQTRFRQQIADVSQELGDAILWTGFCTDDQLSQYFLASDCCVLPFHRNTFGRTSLAAALQHGMPVITSARAERALFLRHGENAMLVPPDEPERLVALLKEVLGSSDLRRRLSAGAREAADWYSWARVAEMTVEVYREAGVSWPRVTTGVAGAR